MNLWGLMRQQANKHILERDLSNPYPVFDENGIYQDTVNYDRLFIASEQSTFDENFRKDNQIGQLEYIDIDSYTPDAFTLDMFSQDELLNNGSSLVYYYGYDIYGNKNDSRNTLKDFFTYQDNDGQYLRNIAPYNPIYQAGYIQDKFAIRFNF
jgi:hypothetical protein